MLLEDHTSTGHGLDRAVPYDDDYIQQNFIDNKWQEFELGLYATKWFDYRHLTPVQATRQYIEDFGKAYTDTYAREKDVERAPYARPVDLDRILEGLKKGEPKAKQKFVACWRGRQVADALGMPYKIYIGLALTYRLRRWQSVHMPQPQHLFHEYDVEKIQVKWEELQNDTLYTSEHPAYLVQNYQGIAHQNDYHEWLFKQANSRYDPALFLARFVTDDQLPIEKVESRVSDDTLIKVNSYLQ